MLIPRQQFRMKKARGPSTKAVLVRHALTKASGHALFAPTFKGFLGVFHHPQGQYRKEWIEDHAPLPQP